MEQDQVNYRGARMLGPQAPGPFLGSPIKSTLYNERPTSARPPDEIIFVESCVSTFYRPSSVRFSLSKLDEKKIERNLIPLYRFSRFVKSSPFEKFERFLSLVACNHSRERTVIPLTVCCLMKINVNVEISRKLRNGLVIQN